MLDLDRLKGAIVTQVDGNGERLAALAHEIYLYPETGLNEVRTSALLADLLEQEGFAVERGIAGLATAFRATWGSGGPRIALLAEMDALPGLGHACGHNIIGVAAAGAALALRHAMPAAAARIVVFGTPAEELGVGKVELVKDGFFSDIDFAMMVHPSAKRQVSKGYLGLAKVRYTFFGRPAHAAAYPDEGVNALDAVLQTFNGVNALRQQLRQDVRVHGIITDGGVAPNIIPARAACYFYVRAEDLAELARVRSRVNACAEGAAKATGCRLEIEEDERVLAPLKLNQAFAALYSAQLDFLGLPEVAAEPANNRGSSDIGNVSQVVPTIHPHVPIGAGVHIHSEAFAQATVSAQGRLAVVEGAKTLALTAAELAFSAKLRQLIVAEFNK